MRIQRIGSIGLLSLALCAADAAAQGGGGAVVAPERQVIVNGVPQGDIQLPGMPGRNFKTGTGRIRGRVVASDNGAPVRRAQVRVSGPDIASKTAMTDGEGRYAFGDLPASRFTLAATKSGYVSVQYGQTRPFESGKPIELAEAQALDKADISMPRGSVISGRVLDEFGDPVADADVTALRSSWSNGRRRLQSTGRITQTNDLGQYRLFGLPPGDYYVNATLRGGDAMIMDLALAAGGTPGPTGSSPRSGYAPTFFPGTTVPSDAQKITLAAGQEAQGTEFALAAVRLAKVSGVVINSEGKPVEGSMVSALPRNPEGAVMLGMGQNSARTDKNGNFTLNGVVPGEYTLQTRAMTIMTSSGGGGDNMMFAVRIGGPGAGGGDAEFGSVPLNVTGEDVGNLVVMTTKGTTATGRVTFEGGAKPNETPSLRVTTFPADSQGGMVGRGTSQAIKPDGSFEVKGLAGPLIVRPTGLPTGWTMKSVKLNGADVTDNGIDFKPGQAIEGLEVVLTSAISRASGTVTASSGTPVKDYTVVFFSDDPQHWTAPQTRWVIGTRPDQEGKFQIRDLPPGGYYAIAVDYIPQGEWGDPELLDRLKGKATRVSIDEGESKTVQLKIAG